MFLLRFIFLVFCLVALSHTGYAQRAEIAPAQQNILGSFPERPAQSPRDILPDVADDKITAVDDDIFIDIKGFAFTGNTVFSADTLSMLLLDDVNRKLNFRGVLEIAAKVTQYYRDRGYFVAKAYLPVQEIQDGIIRFRLIEGLVSHIQVDNQAHLSDSIVRDMMSSVRIGEVLKKPALERAMLLLNDLSGIRAKSFLKPGDNPGETHLSILIENDQRFSGYVVANNHAAKSAGRYTALSSLRSANVFADGGYIDILGSVSKRQGSAYQGLFFRKPVGRFNLFLEAGVSHLSTDTVAGSFQDLGITSESILKNVALSHPLIRSYKDNWVLSVGGQSELYRQNNSSLNVDFEDELENLYVKLSGARRFENDIVSFEINFEKGVSELDGDASDLFAKGDYNLWRWSVSERHKFSDKNSLLLKARGQISKDRLLPVKQFSVGGYDRVRAFHSGESLGDRGSVVTAEFAHIAEEFEFMPDWLSRPEVYSFLDFGRSTKNEERSGEEKKRTHQGIGGGVRMTTDHGFSIDIGYATRLGRDAAATDNLDDERVWAQMVYQFGL